AGAARRADVGALLEERADGVAIAPHRGVGHGRRRRGGPQERGHRERRGNCQESTLRHVGLRMFRPRRHEATKKRLSFSLLRASVSSWPTNFVTFSAHAFNENSPVLSPKLFMSSTPS